MRYHVLVFGACIGGPMFSGVADAQSEAPEFCATAGAYMQDIAARRDQGMTQEDAVTELEPVFDAFAASQADLAVRRRVLAVGGPLATFAFGLPDLQPATVQLVGEAYCLEQGGDISLAPPSTTSRRIAAEARECEAESAGSSTALRACVAQAVEERDVRVAREPSPEAPQRSRIQPFYEFALAYGGDAVGTIIFVSGDQQDIDAGDGITAGGGVLQRINDSFGIKYTAGYKVSFSDASNADVMKSVLPIDIVPYYQRGAHRFGFGLSHHLSPKIDWDWLAPTTNFDDATGVILEYSYKRFSFSYTDIDYESGAATFDAGHVSVKYTSRY